MVQNSPFFGEQTQAKLNQSWLQQEEGRIKGKIHI